MTADELAAVPTGSPEEDGWEAPIPLSRSAVPPLPLGVLPPWLERFAVEVSRALQVPRDLVGLLGLSVCSAAIAGRVIVRINLTYHEPLNVWLVIALPSANVKSAAVRLAVAPIVQWEAEEAERLRDEIAEATSRFTIRQGALQKAERSASSANGTDRLQAEADAYTLAREVAGIHVPHAPRLLADDATAERMATLLMEHDGRMAIISPEGDVFDLMGGKYSNNIPNIGVYLRAHVGDMIKVDRQGRPPDFVASPALTMGLSPQPDVLRGLTSKPGFRGRGLLARFLYSLPHSLVGYRNWDAAEETPIPESVLQTYTRHVRALLRITPDRDEHGHDRPYVLTLSPEAQDLWRAFRRETETQLRPSGDLAGLQDWGGKLWGAAVRLAGVLHVAEHAIALSDGDALTWPISVQTMTAALALARYFIPHAKAAFLQMGADDVHDRATDSLDWIGRTTTTTFTRRECWQGVHGRTGFEKADDLDAPLTRLCDHGYIRHRIVVGVDGERKMGRPASPSFDVNPLMDRRNSVSEDDQNDQNDQNSNYGRFDRFDPPPSPLTNGHAPTPAGVVTGDDEKWETF